MILQFIYSYLKKTRRKGKVFFTCAKHHGEMEEGRLRTGYLGVRLSETELVTSHGFIFNTSQKVDDEV